METMSSKLKYNIDNKVSINFSLSLKNVKTHSVVFATPDHDNQLLHQEMGISTLHDNRIGIIKGTQKKGSQSFSLIFSADKDEIDEHIFLNEILSQLAYEFLDHRSRLRDNHFGPEDNRKMCKNNPEVSLWDKYQEEKQKYLELIRPYEKERRIAISKHDVNRASDMTKIIQGYRDKNGLTECQYIVKLTICAMQTVKNPTVSYQYDRSQEDGIARIKGNKLTYIFPIVDYDEYTSTINWINHWVKWADEKIMSLYTQSEIESMKESPSMEKMDRFAAHSHNILENQDMKEFPINNIIDTKKSIFDISDGDLVDS